MTTPMIVNGIPVVETPLDRRIREVRQVQRGLEAKGLDTDICMHPQCWQPTAPGLEREQERVGNYNPIAVCPVCGLTPITAKQKRRLIEAGEADARDRVANLTRTLHAQHRSGSWVCQHGKTWYLLPPQPHSLAGGRPVHSPARTLASGTDWYAFDCGFDRDCAAEHRSRMYEEVDRGPRWPL